MKNNKKTEKDSVVLIKKGDEYYHNGEKVDYDEMEKLYNLIVLPDNKRDE